MLPTRWAKLSWDGGRGDWKRVLRNGRKTGTLSICECFATQSCDRYSTRALGSILVQISCPQPQHTGANSSASFVNIFHPGVTQGTDSSLEGTGRGRRGGAQKRARMRDSAGDHQCIRRVLKPVSQPYIHSMFSDLWRTVENTTHSLSRLCDQNQSRRYLRDHLQARNYGVLGSIPVPLSWKRWRGPFYRENAKLPFGNEMLSNCCQYLDQWLWKSSGWLLRK